MPNIASLTKYHKAFQRTYWGNFSTMAENLGRQDPGHSDIIANRNKFVEDYEISNKWGLKSPVLDVEPIKDHEQDHLEYYRTKNGGIVVICSNYNTTPNPVLKMQEVAPLYSRATKTYLRHWNSLVNFKKDCRTY